MTPISLKHRDHLTLRLLSWTQASAQLILKASQTFELPDSEPHYRDERRVRERMQALSRAGLVRSAPVAGSERGVVNWYRLTTEGFRTVYGDKPLPVKSFFEPIRLPPSGTLSWMICVSE
jgi:hypothetical protein